MAVKEIKELEDAILEVEVKDPVEAEGNWVEENLEAEGEVEEDVDEGFSIGDTALARGKAKEFWGAKGLEEEIREFEVERGNFVDDFEDGDEEFGEAGFSYEVMGGAGNDLYGGVAGSDFYGGGSVTGLYGASGKGGSNLYGAVNNSGANSYVVGGGGDVELASYNIGGIGKKSNKNNMYKVEGAKKKRARRDPEKSGLVNSVRAVRPRSGKGVSMM